MQDQLKITDGCVGTTRSGLKVINLKIVTKFNWKKWFPIERIIEGEFIYDKLSYKRKWYLNGRHWSKIEHPLDIVKIDSK